VSRKKRWLVLVLAFVGAAAVAAFLFPIEEVAIWDGRPGVTIHFMGASALDLTRIRYWEIRGPSDLSVFQEISDEELLSDGKEPVEVSTSSVTVTVWNGGRRGRFTNTYYQVYAALLLIPRPDGPIVRKVVVLPDLRQSRSVAVDLRE